MENDTCVLAPDTSCRRMQNPQPWCPSFLLGIAHEGTALPKVVNSMGGFATGLNTDPVFDNNKGEVKSSSAFAAVGTKRSSSPSLI
mmetsp:Transcript_24724/g.59603  ORF Transcript_24724/g.59603 Transcript_24724/m.59603 type:complete len:86 (+) Transcript_24724:199-456(+)